MSEAKKTHALAMSSGVPPRFKGIESLQPCTVASSNLPVISVSIKPGAITLLRTFLEPSSKATDFENPRIPDLEAA